MNAKKIYDIKVFSYCILKNQIHLVIKPDNTPKNISLFMKRVAGRQSRYTNARYMRSGSLWDGRFKSSPIDEKVFLHACCRYVEYLPYYLRILKTPENYQWSSLAYHSGLRQQDIIDDLSETNLSMVTNVNHENQYRNTLQQSFSIEDYHLIHNSIQQGILSGKKISISNIGQDQSTTTENIHLTADKASQT